MLVVAVAVTGVVWLLDLLWWRPARQQRLATAEVGTTEGLNERAREKALKEPWPVDYARSFFPVLLVVLVLRSFVVEPFQIPSGSMRPTHTRACRKRRSPPSAGCTTTPISATWSRSTTIAFSTPRSFSTA